ncbi:MAG: acetate/propionate family kinase [Candidatus Sumerlaeota bacterium]|nr:acetate/propionate family kinase [Candidatus Sumerlaeota bacterium]
MRILIVNVGSTSLKFRLFDLDRGEAELAVGRLEGIGAGKCPFKMSAATGKATEGVAEWPDYTAALESTIEFLTRGDRAPLASLDDLGGVGFKCVHGGPRFTGAHVLTEEVLLAMEETTFLAPSHNPPYIKAIRAVAALLPKTPLASLFEPAFYSTLPAAAKTYAVPYEWEEKFGVRKYGFHGASHRYIAERVPQLLGRGPEGLRTISCHLGGSSSITAIRDGKAVDHSFGMSVQSGLLHGTRTGDLDPFVPLYLMEKHGWSLKDVATALAKESGLKGLSGVSSEYRDVEAAAQAGNARARLAVDVFVHGVRHYIGAFVASLGGLDVLAFTGGIGERSVSTRARICQGLECLGLRLDAKKNAEAPVEGPIHAKRSKAQIWVVPTNEEIVVARESARVIKGFRL